MSLARHEHLLADAREAAIPDEAWAYVKADCCGCVIPKDEALFIDHVWVCAEHAPEYKRLKAVCAMSDGRRA